MYAAIEGSPDATSVPAGITSEIEEMYLRAYEAENERATLLKQQLEDALTEKLKLEGGDNDVKISVAPIDVPTPSTGGTSWRQAYTAVKEKAGKMEAQLKKVSGFGAKAPPQVQPAPAENVVSQVEPVQQSRDSRIETDPRRQVEIFQEIVDLALDGDALLRLIAVAVLPDRALVGLGDPQMNQEMAKVDSLPPMAKVRDALESSSFSITKTVAFF